MTVTLFYYKAIGFAPKNFLRDIEDGSLYKNVPNTNRPG